VRYVSPSPVDLNGPSFVSSSLRSPGLVFPLLRERLQSVSTSPDGVSPFFFLVCVPKSPFFPIQQSQHALRGRVIFALSGKCFARLAS